MDSVARVVRGLEEPGWLLQQWDVEHVQGTVTVPRSVPVDMERLVSYAPVMSIAPSPSSGLAHSPQPRPRGLALWPRSHIVIDVTMLRPPYRVDPRSCPVLLFGSSSKLFAMST
jgi:hypothetical protein